MGRRDITFSRELYIDQDDFMQDPPKKFFRLSPGAEVRLRYGYAITCDEVIRNDAGDVIELRCSYDPLSAKGKTADGRKIKGIIHWVSAVDAVDAEIRVYDRLFDVPNPGSADEFTDELNQHSLVIHKQAKVEPSVVQADKETRFQLERVGYFCFDSQDHCADQPVLNRTVSLRDTWANQKSS